MIILEKLKEVGTDIDTTLERFMGNKELYIKFLIKFTSDVSMQELESAVMCMNLEKAFNAAHTLKGVTGNLGLESIYTLIEPYVELLRGLNGIPLSVQKETEVKESFEAIKRAYNQVYDIICACQNEYKSI